MRLEFTINVPPITKKNHSRIVTVHGHPMLLPSKQYVQYEKDCAPFMPHLEKPIDFPVNVQAVFYVQKRHAKCDLVNYCQSCLDLLVEYGVLADDNRNIVFTLNNSKVLYSKESPRTVVTITGVPEGEFERWK